MTGWLLLGGAWVVSVTVWYVLGRKLYRDRSEIRQMATELECAALINAQINEVLTECLADAQTLHEDDDEEDFAVVARVLGKVTH